jgi:hypothetical protein
MASATVVPDTNATTVVKTAIKERLRKRRRSMPIVLLSRSLLIA